ncbi:hypothetical protein SAMN04487943_102460 [Gracilibacillus orientalis]|uniref:Uncharacterized protein n=1 Tax=Gracilibacillus orientalis TaxID=334253 RepID=A0A1I4J5H6_9BACI|nr:hypothetical protein [Gracilibacillus orientalis]SFL61443.1 hypothetical protein SAMN04487943_102460 [Gracilibacillus orientalis]
MSIIKEILYAILPMIDCNSANKDVSNEQSSTWNKLLQRESLPDVEKFAVMDKKDAEYLINSIRDNISSLQDKAKVTAVAVTLAFSMVGGISSYMLNLKEKLYANEFLTGILVLFVIASCFYLIVSGYYSLLTLNSKPKYDFGRDDFEYISKLSTEEKKKKQRLIMMGEHYKMTTFQNTTLNNYVDCSNNNLRNALIALGIFFSLICISFALADDKPMKQEIQIKVMHEQQAQLIKDVKTEINTLQNQLNEIRITLKKDKIDINSFIKELDTKIDKIINANLQQNEQLD